MLIELNKDFAESLSTELEELSEGDREYFRPHEFDAESIRSLCNEPGNHYYIYLDDLGEFAGYGMLRTFGEYRIPTLGCVIWPQDRGRGNGKLLVQELVDKARQLAYPQLTLKVHPDNRIARGLYEKAGFKEVSKTENGLIWLEYDFGEEGNKDAG